MPNEREVCTKPQPIGRFCCHAAAAARRAITPTTTPNPTSPFGAAGLSVSAPESIALLRTPPHFPLGRGVETRRRQYTIYSPPAPLFSSLALFCPPVPTARREKKAHFPLATGAKVCHNTIVHFFMQRYRSGHNGADSKSVCGQPHVGSNPTRCAIKNNPSPFGGGYFLSGWDSKPERVSGVKKMCRGHIFSREVRSGYAARTNDANEVPRHYPTRCAIKNNPSPLGGGLFFIRVGFEA